jgi:cytochrome c-type biogenesis protein CcmH
MKTRFSKIIITVTALFIATGINGYLEAPQRAGLSLFSKGGKCSPLFCNLKTGVASIPRQAYADDQSEIEEAMVCQCGCGIVLKHCPHQNCEFAIPARKLIAQLLKEGKKKDEVIDIFVKQFGQKVLAAPKKEGFNILGYVLPFVAFIVAAFFISRVIKTWTSRGVREEEKVLEHLPEDAGSELDKKIEEELKKLD